MRGRIRGLKATTYIPKTTKAYQAKHYINQKQKRADEELSKTFRFY
jgi:hypothetical protein